MYNKYITYKLPKQFLLDCVCGLGANLVEEIEKPKSRLMMIIIIMIIIIIPGSMTADKGCNNTKKNNTEVDFFVHFSL